ncbi:MAG: hypothetical protein LQ346_006290 [Caloplaca aetnensis]|nr:MAG: hypothetical protein LQ346_006290 [Caloplaca aetnensis]
MSMPVISIDEDSHFGSQPKNIQWAQSTRSFGAATSSIGASGSGETNFHSTVEWTHLATEDDDDYLPTVDPSIATVDEDSPWARKYILSLDGGGVRGYSSLLLLKRLMDEIAGLEAEMNPQAGTSAFSPLIDLTSLYRDPMMKELEYTYRPCHYFDYIGGSSTGGLTAIMLGRLRMTVDECLKAYKDLSATVFEKPTSRLKRSLHKYSSATRRKTLEQLFATWQPAQPSANEQRGKFKSDAVRCRTIVCSNRWDLSEKISYPYVFRSYDYRHVTRRTVDPFVYPRNPNDSPEFEIWQVARATSAAPSYFKSTRLFEYRYNDAAVNINNPSLEMYKEVSLLNKAHESVELLLSLGTGNAKGNTTKAKHALQKDLNDISDLVHQKINAARKQDAFTYYRWNVPNGLEDVRLDEWKPIGTGKDTLVQIDKATNGYLGSVDVQRQIRECATILVHARWQRAQTMRWEMYATGTRYRCVVPGCEYQSLRFQNRNELMDHLQTVHGKAPPDAENFQEIQTLLDQGRTNSD